MSDERIYDVVIAGGGLAGLCLARQLLQARPGLAVRVLEAKSHPVPKSAHKVGESSVEIAGRYFRDILGLGDHLAKDHLPKLGLRYFLSKGDKADITKRLEVGPIRNKVPIPFKGLLLPSFQLDRGVLENFLAADLPESVFVDRAKVQDIVLSPRDSGPHRVLYERDGQPEEVRGRWVIEAMSRRKLLKTKLGIDREPLHKCNSAWWRVKGRVKCDAFAPHGEWAERIGAPVRWHSTVHFMDEGYWVWLIPLGPDTTSVGIVADPRIHPWNTMNRHRKAMEWLEKNEPQVADALKAPEHELLDFLGLVRYSENAEYVYSKDRWGLTGDGGLFTDPFYSPGSDFIGISNTFLLDLIGRDLDGEDISGRVDRTNAYYKLLYEQFVRVYHDEYPVMGNPQVMAAKIVFDNAFYWGWVAQLFFNGRLTDVDFLDSFRKQIDRSVSLQGRAEQLFREWNAREKPPIVADRLDQFDVRMLWSIYAQLVLPADGDALKKRLVDTLDKLEAFVELLFRRAARGTAVETARTLDVHRLTLDPIGWDAALFRGPERRELLARVRSDIEAMWVDGSGGPRLPWDAAGAEETAPASM